MEEQMKCPICNNTITAIVINDDYGLTEQHFTCPYCGIVFDFEMGIFHERLFGQDYAWDFTSKDNPMLKPLKQLEYRAKRNWKKFKKKCN